jgi:hypothetical protein
VEINTIKKRKSNNSIPLTFAQKQFPTTPKNENPKLEKLNEE